MTDFPVAKNSYVAFDGLTIKEKMRERLNQTGIFTDQNFEGSNLAGINDAFGMAFSLLLYYVNNQSANGDFSITTLYENINRVVKEIGYNPIGYQTASVNFSLSGGEFDIGTYTIPRYSQVDVAGLPYSFANDLQFIKKTSTTEELLGINSNETLYQGVFIEYPLITPAGNSNETITINADDDSIIDDKNIDVYVKTDGVWKKWQRTASLFLNSFNDHCYEIRFNENKKYEIKFGDNINGKKLNSTDLVAIYYLSGNGKDGEIGVNALSNKKLNSSLTTQLQEILNDVLDDVSSLLSSDKFSKLTFNNKYPSTLFNEFEGVESIRKNAPATFRAQFSVSTNKAYETFVKSNFANIVHDVKIKNNKEYLDSYIKYYYNLGLSKPQLESRALFNQVEYSDSCGFNNVYIFVVPKSFEQSIPYLSPTQKENIVNELKGVKVLTSDTVPMDPVYLAFDFCIDKNVSNVPSTFIGIKKTINSKRSENSIKNDVANSIISFFSIVNNKLGETKNINELLTILLSIDGVSDVSTINGDVSLPGLNIILWNPIYSSISVERVEGRKILEDFQFPYLNDKNIIDRIRIL